jgi:Tol biopolymer transport system component
LIQRCLVKDRRERVADLSVASFVLGESGVLATTDGRPQTVEGRSQPSRWRSTAPAAAAAFLTAMLLGLGAWVLWPAVPERPVVRFNLTLAGDQRVTNFANTLLALSPDGRQLAWIGAGGRIWLRSLAEYEARAPAGLATSSVLSTPVFSPDGTSLAFYSQDEMAIKRIAVAGGAAVSVCAVDAGGVQGMSWDTSGILAAQPSGIVRCAGDGTRPERLISVEEGEQAHGPQMLPDGRSVLFTLAQRSDSAVERWNKARIVVQSLASGERRTLIEGGSDARYLPTGHLLYAVGGGMLAVPFDPAGQAVTEAAVSVLEGVNRSIGSTTAAAQVATSGSGHLVYVPGPARLGNTSVIAVADRQGTVTLLKAPPGQYAHVRASPDGTLLALDTADQKDANVSTFAVDGTTALRRLTFGGRSRFPVWSPDGQRIAFQSDREGDLALFAQRVDGTGVERLTKAEKDEAHVPESWSPDGRHVSFAVQKGSEFSLWILSLADGKAAQFRDVRSREPLGSVFSPDGRWIAYHALPAGASPASSGSGVFVEPFPPTGALYQAPKVGRDFQPVWSDDGSELLYVGTAASGQMVSLPVSARAGITFGRPTTFPFVVGASRLSGNTRAFDVLTNDRFVGIVAESAADRAADQEIRVVLNWFDELERLVPRR